MQPGYQRNNNNHHAPAPPGPPNAYSNRSNQGYASSPLVAALDLFFELRDSKYQAIVEDLFNLYEFSDIAYGIYKKYKTLPEGWKGELTRRKQQGGYYANNNSLDWLDLNSVKWYSETTDTYPSVDKSQLPRRGNNEDSEKVVDEFIENERKYFEKLQAFMKCYVSEVEAIVENKIGERAKNSLGLSQQQVKYVFGTHLLQVYLAVEKLLIALEALTLVPMPPKTPGGRPAHLAHILEKEGPNLVQAYAPYNARYQVAKRVLERQTFSLGENYYPGNDDEIMRHLNFKELWTEISQSKQELKNLGIDSILIMPIRRFPNYKLFVDRLCKTLTPNHSAHEYVFECLKKVDFFTRQIDDAVKQKSDEEERTFRRLVGDE